MLLHLSPEAPQKALRYKPQEQVFLVDHSGPLVCSMYSIFKESRTRAIITRGLYTFYPLFELHLCTVTFDLMYG